MFVFQKWENADLNGKFKLPMKNEFIPTNFEIYPLEKDSPSVPTLIKASVFAAKSLIITGLRQSLHNCLLGGGGLMFSYDNKGTVAIETKPLALCRHHVKIREAELLTTACMFDSLKQRLTKSAMPFVFVSVPAECKDHIVICGHQSHFIAFIGK